MDIRIPVPLRRILARILLVVGAIWWLLSFIGNIQTARELVGGRSEAVLSLLTFLAPSQWLGLSMFIGGVVALCLNRQQPIPTKKRPRAKKRVTKAPAPAAFPDPIIFNSDLPEIATLELPPGMMQKTDAEKHEDYERERAAAGIEIVLPRESEKKKRQEVRDKLSTFLIVADKLKKQCISGFAPIDAADKWYSETATYIRENVSYADKNRFISDTNVPKFPELEPSPLGGQAERERIWQFLNNRSYQLAKILDELKPL